MSLRALVLAWAAVLPHATAAGSPSVVTDIPPVHSLVAQVLGDAGTPHLLLDRSDAHGAALRPSQAAHLQEAELVVWMGPELNPQLAESLAALAEGAEDLRLLGVEGTRLLPIRDADEHADGHADGKGHAGQVDPHAWLDPANAVLWLDAIAAAVAAIDPERASLYQRNAGAGKVRLAAVPAERAEGAPIGVVAVHDSWQYAEAPFGFRTLTALSPGDAAKPGPARIVAVRALLRDAGADCLLAEPDSPPAVVAMLAEGSRVPVVTADPLGVDFAPGPDLYPALLDRIAADLAACR